MPPMHGCGRGRSERRGSCEVSRRCQDVSADGALRVMYGEQARAAANAAKANSDTIENLKKTVPSIASASADAAAADAAADDAEELVENAKTATGGALAYITAQLIKKKDAALLAALKVQDALKLAQAATTSSVPAYDTASTDMSMASGKILVTRGSDGAITGYVVNGTTVSATCILRNGHVSAYEFCLYQKRN